MQLTKWLLIERDCQMRIGSAVERFETKTIDPVWRCRTTRHINLNVTFYLATWLPVVVLTYGLGYFFTFIKSRLTLILLAKVRSESHFFSSKMLQKVWSYVLLRKIKFSPCICRFVFKPNILTNVTILFVFGDKLHIDIFWHKYLSGPRLWA